MQLQNTLKELRTRLGRSQGDLAKAAGVSRQTIGGIEAGLYAPSALVALRLAKALGCRVEEVFWLQDDEETTLQAYPAQIGAMSEASKSPKLASGTRVSLGKVGERWIAHPLQGDAAFCTEMLPADGVVQVPSGASKSGMVEVNLLDAPDALNQTVFLAGCSPAFSLWLRSAARWQPGLRSQWLYANSTQSLDALARGEVHLAGMHLCDPKTGEANLSFVKSRFPKRSMTLVALGAWEEGMVVASGNPKNITRIDDLGNSDVRFVNREPGAGSRLLLDTELEHAGIKPLELNGYGREVKSHQSVAEAVVQGEADAGMTTGAMAFLYGLDFVPLRQVRFDLVLPDEFLDYPPVSQLLETLGHRQVRMQLRELGGYDTSQTGEIVAHT